MAAQEPSSSRLHIDVERFVLFNGVAVFLVCAAGVTVCALGLSLGLVIARWQAPAALLLSAAALYFIAPGARAGERLAWLSWCLLAQAILLIGAWALASAVYDTSWDGQHYHSFAVEHYIGGWNPVLEPDRFPEALATHYPRGAWYLFTSAYALLGDIEAAKLFAPYFASGGLLLLFAALRSFGISRAWSAGLAAGAMANPIVVTQLFTKMVDGTLYAQLVGMCACAILFARNPCRVTAAGFVACGVLLLNLKFTGLPLGVVLCAPACASLIRRHGWRPAAVLAVALAVVGLATAWSPYLHNWRAHGHPLYPLAGPQGINLMERQAKVNMVDAQFDGEGRLRKFILGLRARPQIEMRSYPQPRPLYEATRNDWYAAASPDARLGGFGCWMGIVLLVASAACIPLVFFDWRAGVATLAALAVLMGSVFMLPDPWWARYVPQLWFVPFAVAIGLLCVRNSSHRRAAEWCAAGVVCVAMLDAGFFGYTAMRRAELMSMRQMEAVDAMQARAGEGRLLVELSGNNAMSLRLRDRGIAFQPVDTLPKPSDTVAVSRVPHARCRWMIEKSSANKL